MLKSDACEVAAAYAAIVVANANRRAIVFTADDEPFYVPIAGGEWFMMNSQRPTSATPPPAALVKRLEDQGNQNAVGRCLSVRKLLDGRSIGYGQKKVDAQTKVDAFKKPAELFRATIQTISVPVVSVDGKQAVLASSAISGPLAAGGMLQLLNWQPDGSWKVVAFSPLWVS